MNAEILAPAGDEKTAAVALLAGADAVYIGLTRFSARDSAENFDVSALSRTAELAHLLGAKVYVCLNTLVKDDETEAFFSAAREAWNAGADAILVQDLFLGRELSRAYPEIVLHLSTQAGCCNVYGAELAAKCGFSRAVLARETPLKDIAEISKVIETEVFVQGALCSCFSGQCYFSSFAGNNSGNRGRCKQPCRKKYTIDRAGYEEAAYALSLSDLCVGDRTEELLRAGVTSLKIEGRLRRAEYVAAAVKYYRALIGGKEEFSRLKRAFNRGDYTHGLAFEKKVLSRKVQGHIGEDVGAVSIRGGRYFCESAFRARKGDGFKFLRAGVEVGGGICSETAERGFYLTSGSKLATGDRVRVTTDTAGNEEALRPVKSRKISLEITMLGGEPPKIVCGEFAFEESERLPVAQNAPLSEAEIAACFRKTDGLPFTVETAVNTRGAFLPKSALNALRRRFYAALTRHLAPPRAPLEERTPAAAVTPVKGSLTAVITSDERGEDADIVIYKPLDQRNPVLPARGGEKYLYLPPMLTGEEARSVISAAAAFDGIYCEGYYGIALAEACGKPLFAGTGFNLTNRYAVGAVKEYAKYFALSKELSTEEQRAIAAEGAFALTAGGVKLMDLCFCPFEQTCRSCDKREQYTLTDEAGRQFPLRRYRRANGECRFEVYNCAPLSAGDAGASLLADCTLHGEDLLSATSERAGATRGHSNRSMQ